MLKISIFGMLLASMTLQGAGAKQKGVDVCADLKNKIKEYQLKREAYPLQAFSTDKKGAIFSLLAPEVIKRKSVRAGLEPRIFVPYHTVGLDDYQDAESFAAEFNVIPNLNPNSFYKVGKTCYLRQVKVVIKPKEVEKQPIVSQCRPKSKKTPPLYSCNNLLIRNAEFEVTDQAYDIDEFPHPVKGGMAFFLITPEVKRCLGTVRAGDVPLVYIPFKKNTDLESADDAQAFATFKKVTPKLDPKTFYREGNFCFMRASAITPK
ncbi:MAG TPA: hypothetical protein VEL47_00785 [Myxococcota bacterium]|nr:hypothetical protein [Myxococcota bacterium]